MLGSLVHAIFWQTFFSSSKISYHKPLSSTSSFSFPSKIWQVSTNVTLPCGILLQNDYPINAQARKQFKILSLHAQISSVFGASFSFLCWSGCKIEQISGIHRGQWLAWVSTLSHVESSKRFPKEVSNKLEILIKLQVRVEVCYLGTVSLCTSFSCWIWNTQLVWDD